MEERVLERRECETVSVAFTVLKSNQLNLSRLIHTLSLTQSNVLPDIDEKSEGIDF